MLKDVRSKICLADSGYDGEGTYESLKKKGMLAIIKPPNCESSKDQGTDRDEAVSYINEKGYQAWRVKNNYGRSERVENCFFRFKNVFGSKFASREEKRQINENRIKCQLLNQMFNIGRCISVLVA